MQLKLNWDGLGIAASLACAIHCAVLPLMLTTLPLFGINIIHNAYFEWGMILLTCLIGAYSLYHGFIKHHRNSLPVYLFIAGCILLFVKQFFHAYEYFFLAPAVVLIVAAHYRNFRLCQKRKCNSPHHVH